MRWILSPDRNARQIEVDRNLEAFREKLPELLRTHAGKFALLRNREVTGFYDSLVEALVAGQKFYSDQLFSIQEVTEASIDLGFFSHAVHLG
jgi:hypothetical protein